MDEIIGKYIPEEVFNRLHSEYKDSLRDKLNHIEEIVQALHKKVNVSHLEKLRFIVHKISGTAGFYGHIDLGECCTSFEFFLNDKLKQVQNGQELDFSVAELNPFVEEVGDLIRKQILNEVKGEDKAPKKPFKVILVDDDVDLTKILEYSFRSLGYKITIFHTGNEALKYLSDPINAMDPTLLILDRLLPDMDGLELIKKISHFSFSYPPEILILSCLSADKDVLEGLKEGAFDYIVKPFNISIFMEKTLGIMNR